MEAEITLEFKNTQKHNEGVNKIVKSRVYNHSWTATRRTCW